jgi:hypothetical protein
MKKMVNEATYEGRVFQHKLVKKTVSNQSSKNFGKEFISGTLDIATDDAGLNVVQVHYTYVTATTNAGSENRTFTALSKIMDGPTWVENGKDEAMKIKATTAIGLNEFYSSRDNQIVSQMINEGGFINIINSLSEEKENKRNKFIVDMLITKATRVEADPEKNIDKDYLNLRGVIFNFRNAILPITLKVTNEKGIEDFESLDVSSSNPYFIKVWGKNVNTTVTITKEVDASDWGEAYVDTQERNVRDWVISGRAAVPYEFGEEGVLTTDELTKAQQDRELVLAEIKKRNEEYNASKGETVAPAPAKAIAPKATSEFNF